MSIAVHQGADAPHSPFISRPPYWRKATPLLAATVIGGAVAWHGSDRQPVDASQPLVLRGETVSERAADATFRIGTFNIHGGRGPGESENLEATAAVLGDHELDFVGLYEVHGGFTTDQAERLGERLAMASLFAGSEHRWWHDHVGNGLLTRRPLRSVIRFDLPGTQGKRFRHALLATFDVEGTSVKILATHLDTETDRPAQLAAVCELFRSLEPPVVLMGDLNCTADEPALAALLSEPDVIDAVAAKHGPASQRGRIDHLIVRGLTVVDTGVVATKASDHPYVWAELRP